MSQYFNKCLSLEVMNRHLAPILLILLFIAQLSRANGFPALQHISKAEGLPHTRVNAILQDSYGFIWIGTGKGLCRYDGVELKVYLNTPDDTASLSANTVMSLHEDTIDGRHVLLVGLLGGGADIYLYHSDRFTYPKAFQSLRAFSVNDFIRTKEGHLWIATSNGLYFLSNKDDLFSGGARLLHIIKHENIKEIHFEKPGRLWASTVSKLYKVETNFPLNSQITTGHFKAQLTEFPQGAGAIFQLDKETLWLATGKGVYAFSTATERFEPVPVSLPLNEGAALIPATAITRDAAGRIWIGTHRHGLMYCNDPSDPVIRPYHLNGDSHELSSLPVSTLTVDRDNNLWIGTFKQGISHFNLDKSHFNLLPLYTKQQQNTRSVYSVFPVNRDYCLVGTSNGGLDLVNIRTKEYRTFVIDTQNKMLINNGVVTAVFIDSRNRLWVGLSNHGVYRYDLNSRTPESIARYLQNQQFKNFTPESQENNFLNGWSIRKVFEDTEGNIWIGTVGHLNKFDETTQGFEEVKLNPGNTDPRLSYFKNLYEARDGWENILWVMTDGGLVLLENERPVFVVDEEKGLNDNKTWSLYQDEEGVFWLGTASGGINQIRFLNRHGAMAKQPDEIDSVQVAYFTTRNGLPDNTVYSILSDGRGGSWISTEMGLSHYDPAKKGFLNYGVFNRTLNQEFNFGAYARYPENGTLYFGSSAGLTWFHPDSIQEDHHPPAIVFTQLKIMNKEVAPGDTVNERVALEQSMLKTDVLHVYHDDKLITVEFAALHFKRPSANKYKYMLEGFDDEWIYADADRNFATYSNLPAGEYTLRVNAANAFGVWNETDKTLQIIVHPPWWATIWAIAAYVLLAIIGVVLIWRIMTMRERYNNRLKIERIRFENEQELARRTNELNQLKLRFFMNISHEFRTPLTLILSPLSNVLKKQGGSLPTEVRKQLGFVQRNADRLLRLINQLLDLRKLESGAYKLNISHIHIYRQVQDIYESFTYLAEKHAINYSFESSTRDLEGYMDPDVLDKTLYNLISNAFKFTPDGGSIQVKLETDDNNRCIIRVADSGIGIHEDHINRIFDRFYQVEQGKDKRKGTGIGLALTHELMELHKGAIKVESKPGKGSAFILEFPIDETFYEQEQVSISVSGDQKDTNPEELKPAELILPDPQPAASDVQQSQNTKVKSARQQTILLVEDNAELRSFLSPEFDNHYTVLTAANGKEGLSVVLKQMPDIVVSDVMMPEMDGFELTAEIKSNPISSHIPVILLTSRSTTDDQLKGLTTGADDYIPKPFETEVLLLKIKNILHTKEALRQRFKKEEITPEELTVNSVDESFLKKVFEIVEQRMGDAEFNVEELAKEVNLSRSMLYKKLKALTGETGSAFINTMRMKKAAQLIRKGHLRISEVAYEVGFSDPQYFSKSFKKFYGVSPSDYFEQTG